MVPIRESAKARPITLSGCAASVQACQEDALPPQISGRKTGLNNHNA